MIGAYDVLLAGHARSASLTLVTANTAEFSRVPGLNLIRRVQPGAWLEPGKLAPDGHMNLSWLRTEKRRRWQRM